VIRAQRCAGWEEAEHRRAEIEVEGRYRNCYDSRPSCEELPSLSVCEGVSHTDEVN